jgi:hypothetical protein
MRYDRVDLVRVCVEKIFGPLYIVPIMEYDGVRSFIKPSTISFVVFTIAMRNYIMHLPDNFYPEGFAKMIEPFHDKTERKYIKPVYMDDSVTL